MVNRTSMDDKEKIREKIGLVMATEPALRRSAHLHNFKMPTPWLSWGNQKFLRCSKNAAAVDQSNSTSSFKVSGFDYPVERRISDFDFKHRSPIPKLIFKKNKFVVAGEGGVKDDGIGIGIDAVREKLMLDLRIEADSIKREILRQNDKKEMEIDDSLQVAAETTAEAAEEEAVERPWNLRTRRAAACKELAVSPLETSVSPLKTELKSSRLRGGEKMEARAKFSVTLSKREIEEDYLMIIGDKPPRRPKKRPKTVQKQLDTVFPGLWLREVTPEMYKVEEFPDPKKK